MSKYKMSDEGIAVIKTVLNSTENCEVTTLFNLRERQIRTILKENNVNGHLTRVAVVEFVKEKTGLPESKILKEVK